MLKRLHKRTEPWLTLLDWGILRTGLGPLLVTGLSAAVIGASAWIAQAPIYIILLAAMFAMGGAMFLANQSIRLIGAWKAPSGISRQQVRKMDRENPGGIRLGGATAVVITVLSSALILAAGLLAGNKLLQWQTDLERSYLMILPSQFMVDTNRKDRPLGINVTLINSGNLQIPGFKRDHIFLYPVNDLSESEIENEFRRLDAGIPDTIEVGSGSSIFPRRTNYFVTLYDRRFTDDQWHQFWQEKIKIYLILEFKYTVSGYTRITERCFYYQARDFPSVHECRERVRWK